ncbi:DUF2095 family protein [Candidatus Bathyarchaeota archaeon]|nr:DUF2095 family protein [Candidatus Bathyarchaeota archaeon]
MERDELKKRFPRLAKEMEEGKGKADLEFEVEPPKPKRKFAGYDPNAVDFIRRCNSDEEAHEIIEYLRGREEITVDEAERLCRQLEEEGLRSFGPKKGPGYYERQG